MILYIANKPFKRVPKKYVREIPDVLNYLEDEFCYNLTPSERTALESELFFRRTEDRFLRELKKCEPLVAEQIGESKPMAGYEVFTNDGQKYYTIKLSNNKTIRCPREIYRLAPLKQKVKYATALLNNKIPGPCVEQKQLEF